MVWTPASVLARHVPVDARGSSDWQYNPCTLELGEGLAAIGPAIAL